MTTNCDRITNGCTGPTFPTPPPTNAPTPPPGSNCSGTCFAGIANCGAVGYDSASGTCNAGELCCQPRGTWTGCSPNYDVPAGCAKIGEGHYEPGHCQGGPNAGAACTWDNGDRCGEGHCVWDFTCCQGLEFRGSSCQCPCTSQCATRCGQGDGCGGTCPNTDDGAPPAPTLTKPSANNVYVQADATGKIPITWTTSGTKTNYFQVELHPSTNPASTPGTTTTVYANGWSFTPTSRYYSVRVRGINSTCGTDTGTWSAYVSFQVLTSVSGHVYFDQNGTAALSGSFCTGATTPIPLEVGSLITTGATTDGYGTAANVGGGNFSMYLPYTNNGSIMADLVIENSGEWMCSCPAGCSYPSGINSPQNNVNFYLLNATDPWFQAEGGPVAAYGSLGTVIQSLISPYCQLPDCDPSLIKNQNGGTTDGYALTGGGDVDTSFTSGIQTDQIDENRHNWFAKLNDTPNHQDYTYFAKLLKLPASPESDFGAGATSASKPTEDVVNEGAETYFHNGDLTITNAWDVAADETVIVMVDGNVNVEAETSVADGGFLMIVASGDIVFDAELGHDDLALGTAVVEGVFVASGQIRTPSRGESAGGDKKFVGEGTFVGWSGFSLERDYDDGAGRRRLNNTSPVEYFRYRPDFLQNAPESIKRARYSWRELNP